MIQIIFYGIFIGFPVAILAGVLLAIVPGLLDWLNAATGGKEQGGHGRHGHHPFILLHQIRHMGEKGKYPPHG